MVKPLRADPTRFERRLASSSVLQSRHGLAAWHTESVSASQGCERISGPAARCSVIGKMARDGLKMFWDVNIEKCARATAFSQLQVQSVHGFFVSVLFPSRQFLAWKSERVVKLAVGQCLAFLPGPR